MDFLTRCQDFVKSKIESAVDDRRHDAVSKDGESVTHLAMAISARDLHEQIVKSCPEGTAIPSVQWLRLQFWPKRASAAAHRNTGRIIIKMMVAARQFRKEHVDAYYASAVFRYQKEFCVKFRDVTTFICQDDKHTVKVGEPGCPLAAVERGKRVIVGLNQSMEVGDHDFAKFSLTPSVNLDVEIPEDMDGSFYDGQVYVGLKENAFQPPSAVRHACELKTLHESGKDNPVECHYHDGGPDHNLRYPRTQLAQIAYFMEHNIDYLSLIQTPPHHSWKNPAERVMSNLNLALQGIGVMRTAAPTVELQLKSANSLKAIRRLAKKLPTLKEEVKDSIKPAKVIISDVFSRLQLKEKKFKISQNATNEEMLKLGEQLKKIGKNIDPEILLNSPKPCKLSKEMKEYMAKHCVIGHYQFSILKCQDEECVCGAPRSPPEVFAELHHLPFPVPQGEKYKHFEVLICS